MYAHNNVAYVAHVGDSRGYLLRENKIEQLTEDHSLVNERIRAGMLTPEEAKNYRLKNVITRSLGFENEVEVDILKVPLQVGDILMMCSDGLSNLVEAEEMAHTMLDNALQKATRSLVHQACEAGGDDNITVVMFRIDEL
jgi:protein phosphatase